MLIKFASKIFIIIIITFLLLEISTRFLINNIPLNFITHFNEDIRSEVIKRIGLRSVNDVIEVPRDDNGPPIMIYKPYLKINENFSDLNSVNIKTTDQNGFCNNIELYKNNFIDIMMLGDSFTWCLAVKQNKTFSYLLNEKTKFTSYNLGIPGVGVY